MSGTLMMLRHWRGTLRYPRIGSLERSLDSSTPAFWSAARTVVYCWGGLGSPYQQASVGQPPIVHPSLDSTRIRPMSPYLSVSKLRRSLNKHERLMFLR